MERMDRVALLAVLWFVGWTLTGAEIGRVFGVAWTGAVWGFIFALAAVTAWPLVLPDFLDRWLYDPTPEEERFDNYHEGRWAHWRVMKRSMLPPHVEEPRDTGIHRVFIVAGIWFLFWMVASAAIGRLMSESSESPEALYFGFFNGAWWALWTSFAWPWIMPTKINRWMYRY